MACADERSDNEDGAAKLLVLRRRYFFPWEQVVGVWSTRAGCGGVVRDANLRAFVTGALRCEVGRALCVVGAAGCVAQSSNMHHRGSAHCAAAQNTAAWGRALLRGLYASSHDPSPRRSQLPRAQAGCPAVQKAGWGGGVT